MESKNTNKSVKIPLRRMLAYASTDMAGNLLYVTVTSFILYFYTDVFGISVSSAGIILLIVGILDAINAPIFGFIIDHTHTKWGQCRPFWLIFSLPFAFFFVMVFLCPNIDENLKFWWALISYLLFGFCYSAIATPITSILPNLSSDNEQRLKLNSWRSTGGMLGYFITATFTLSLTTIFSTSDIQSGWRNTAIIFALIGFALLLFAFFNTKEINRPTKGISIITSFKAAKRNWPWFIIIIVFVCYWLGNSSRTSTVVYFSQYYLGNQNFASVLNALVMFQLLGIAIIPKLVKKFSKVHVFMGGMFLAAFGQILCFIAGENEIFLCACWAIASVGTGISVTLPFAMLADAVDYGEWKNGIRATGFITAVGSTFAIKIGSAIGPWLTSTILNISGYVSDVAQSTNTLITIQFCISWLPAIFFITGGLLILLYKPFEKKELWIRNMLYVKRGKSKEDRSE